MFVIAGSSCVRHSLKRDAGMGSSSQDFEDICLRTFSISASETGEKEEKGTPVKDGSGGQC